MLSDEAPVYFRDAGWPFFQGAVMQCTPINIQMRTPAQIIDFNNKIADAAGCDTLEEWFETDWRENELPKVDGLLKVDGLQKMDRPSQCFEPFVLDRSFLIFGSSTFINRPLSVVLDRSLSLDSTFRWATNL